jgi:hypothetical protein
MDSVIFMKCIHDKESGENNEELRVLFAKYNWNNQVEEDEMGRACSGNGGEEECV